MRIFYKQVVYSGGAGHYDFPAISHFGFYVLLPIDRFHPVQTLTINAAGYDTTNVPIFLPFSDFPNATNHIDLYLNHK